MLRLTEGKLTVGEAESCCRGGFSSFVGACFVETFRGTSLRLPETPKNTLENLLFSLGLFTIVLLFFDFRIIHLSVVCVRTDDMNFHHFVQQSANFNIHLVLKRGLNPSKPKPSKLEGYDSIPTARRIATD